MVYSKVLIANETLHFITSGVCLERSNPLVVVPSNRSLTRSMGMQRTRKSGRALPAELLHAKVQDEEEHDQHDQHAPATCPGQHTMRRRR
jgi:hypothetical protein